MEKKEKYILIGAVVIGLGLLLSDGIYTYGSIQGGVVHRYNKFTGSISLCFQDRGCEPFKKQSK